MAKFRYVQLIKNVNKHNLRASVTSEPGDTFYITQSHMTHHIRMVDCTSHFGAAWFIFLATALLSKCGLSAKAQECDHSRICVQSLKVPGRTTGW